MENLKKIQWEMAEWFMFEKGQIKKNDLARFEADKY